MKTQYAIVTDENNDTKYYCQCGRIYNTLGSMRFHLSAECGQEFQCSFCDFRAARKSTLRNHINSGKCVQRRHNIIDYHAVKQCQIVNEISKAEKKKNQIMLNENQKRKKNKE